MPCDCAACQRIDRLRREENEGNFILDADGNPTVKPEVGMLCRSISCGKAYRIEGPNLTAYKGDILVIDPLSGASEYVRLRSLALVSTNPPVPGSKGETTLPDRRRRLLENLGRSFYLSENRGMLGCSAVMQFWRRVFYCHDGPPEQTWFWQSLAESPTNPRLISFAPSIDKIDNIPERRCCSIGKFLRKYAPRYGLDLSGGDIDKASNILGELLPSDYNFTFEVVNGEAVFDTYDDPEAPGSCMAGENYVRWYSDNPDKVSIVRILQGNKLMGRALLWSTDCGATVLDRIYPSDNGPHTAALHKYAEEQGWDYKLKQNSTDNGFKSQRTNYRVTMDVSRHGYPYLDTFKYSDDDPEECDRITLKTNKGEFVFCDTSGDYEGSRRTYCEACGCQMDDDDAFYPEGGSEPYCEVCYNKSYVWLHYRHQGIRVDGEFRVDDTGVCDHCGCRRDRDHLEQVSDELLCETCFEEHTSSCVTCGEVRFIKDMKDNPDTKEGGLVCDVCSRRLVFPDFRITMTPNPVRSMRNGPDYTSLAPFILNLFVLP